MNYINFRGHNLSGLGLGAVQLGINYGIANAAGKPGEEESGKIIDLAFGGGINVFDTAPSYGDSEKVLGKFLRAREANIISKLKSVDFIKNSVDSVKLSLKSTGTDSIFGILLHDCAILKELKKYSHIISNLKSEGLVKYFGVSVYGGEDFETAVESEDIDLIQLPFNLFDHRGVSWLRKAGEMNKLVFIRSIYLQGLTVIKPSRIPAKLSSALPYLEKLESISEKYNIPRDVLSMSFVKYFAGENIILFGCETVSQVLSNIYNYNYEIRKDFSSEDFIQDITESFNNVPESIYNPTKW